MIRVVPFATSCPAKIDDIVAAIQRVGAQWLSPKALPHKVHILPASLIILTQ